MNNFIIITFLVERTINENLLLFNNEYKGNQINLDNTNNFITGIPDLIFYKKPNDKKIYGTGVNKKDRLEEKFIILLEYKIGTNKNLKEEIKQIICYKEIKKYIKEEEIKIEIEINGKNRLLKFLYDLRNSIQFKGKIYCKKSLNTCLLDPLIIKDFIIDNCYINLINPNIGINYVNIIIPYQKVLKEKLINYVLYRKEIEIDLRREICDIVMTDSKISLNKLNKEESLTIEKILLPNGFEEVLELLTYDYKSVRERLIEELGEEEFNTLDKYINLVENKSKQAHRVLIPFNPELTEICTTDNLNLESSINRKNNIDNIDNIKTKDISKIYINKEEIYKEKIEKIKKLISNKEIKILKINKYKIKRDYKEYEVYIYILEEYIEEIKDLLEDRILILEYDVNNLPEEYNFILTEEEKLMILENYLLNS